MRCTIKGAFLALVGVMLLSGGALASEFRGIWIHSWDWGGPGIRTPEETTETLNYAKACHCNAVFVEVRKVADALYDSAYEARASNIAPGYDPLADIISKSHALGMEVHTWVVANRVWIGSDVPADTGHLTNMHPEWLMKTYLGEPRMSGSMYWSDPGHPDAAQRVVDVCTDIASKYDVDGIHLDYIRYPGTGAGYNETSLARFHARYGGDGKPSGSDPRWQNWGCEQVNNEVKKTYIRLAQLKPNVRLSASVWSTATAGRNQVLQDWEAWTRGHYIDFVCPMAYTSDRSLFQGFIRDGLARGHGRNVYIIQGSCENIHSDSIDQLLDIRTLGGIGLGIYSYQEPNVGTRDRDGLKAALTSRVFTSDDTMPKLEWKENPTTGILCGSVTCDGKPVEDAVVSISGLSSGTDGKGFYGITDVPPGTISVSCSAKGYRTETVGAVEITAGHVATRDFVLVPEVNPVRPVISDVQVSSISATGAFIKWHTDIPSDSQVEFGLDSRYGNMTPLDTWRITDHQVFLSALRRNERYHFRVLSKDTAGLPAVSEDFSFSTLDAAPLSEIIVDNTDSANIFSVGPWTVSNYPGGYGTDYLYSLTDSIDKGFFKWIPDLPAGGEYEVSVWYNAAPNRSKQVRYIVSHDGGVNYSIIRNQQENGSQWNRLGVFRFRAGREGSVMTENVTSEQDLVVIADAMKFTYLGNTTSPAISNVSVSDIGDTRAIVTWTTDRPADTQVAYDVAPALSKTTPLDSTLRTAHSVTLSDLTPGKVYQLQCHSADDAGNLRVSETISFTTAQRYSTAPGFIRPGWNLVSVPADPIRADLQSSFSPSALEVFGSELVNGTSFQWWDNDRERGGFRLYSAEPGGWVGPIERGHCYWFMRDPRLTATNLSFLGFPPVGDFTLDIASHSAAPYWIMLGTPFDQSIPCDQVKFANRNYNGGAPASWNLCKSALVETFALGFDPVQRGYFTCGPSETAQRKALEPWLGYWLLVDRAGSLQVVFPKP